MANDEYMKRLQGYLELNDKLAAQLEQLAAPPYLRAAMDLFSQMDFLGRSQLLILNSLVPKSIAETMLEVQRAIALRGAEWSTSLSMLNANASAMVELGARAQDALVGIQLPQSILSTQTFDSIFGSITKAMAATEVAAGMYHLSQPAIRMSLKAPMAYQEFALKQFRRAESDDQAIAARRIQVVERGGDLLDGARAAASAGASMLADSDESYGDELPVNLFSSLNQSVGFVYVRGADADATTAATLSVPYRISTAGVGLVNLVVGVNESAQRNGMEEVFTPTSKGYLASSILPTVIADSEERLGTIVDQLFFMLYEGSGEAKRLITLVSESDLDALWLLKHIRLGYRHDVDHGGASGVRAKHKKIGVAIESLIGQKAIATIGDCKRVQLQLYLKLLEMLRLVLRALESKE